MSSIIKKALTLLSDVRIRTVCLIKIFKIKKNLAPIPLSHADKKACCERWKSVSRLVFTDWARVYAHVTGKLSVDYIPEDLYYCYVEPVLNYKPMSKTESCKSMYAIIYKGFTFPKTILKNDNKVFYNAKDELLDIRKNQNALKHALGGAFEVVVKPSLDSGGGYGVRKFALNKVGEYVSESETLSLEMLERLYKSDYLIQEAVLQHDYFAAFNNSSVNTLRIYTYRSFKDESVHVLHTILRVGTPGSVTDNQATGGVSVSINQAGRLNQYAVNKMGQKFESINGILLSKAPPVPDIERFHTTVCSLASRIKYSRVLGHDVTMDTNGNIIIIEVNNKSNEINFFQMNNGPLFGVFTQEVIDACSKAQRSFCFDYQI